LSFREASRRARAERRHAAVDEHDTFIRLETGDAAEARLKEGTLCDLDRSAGPEETRFVRRLAPHRLEAF
jgi:hypothetical protein